MKAAITAANLHYLKDSPFIEVGEGEYKGSALWQGRREDDGERIQILAEEVEGDFFLAFFVEGEHTQSLRLSYDAVDGVLQLLGYFLAP